MKTTEHKQRIGWSSRNNWRYEDRILKKTESLKKKLEMKNVWNQTINSEKCHTNRMDHI